MSMISRFKELLERERPYLWPEEQKRMDKKEQPCHICGVPCCLEEHVLFRIQNEKGMKEGRHCQVCGGYYRTCAVCRKPDTIPLWGIIMLCLTACAAVCGFEFLYRIFLNNYYAQCLYP